MIVTYDLRNLDTVADLSATAAEVAADLTETGRPYEGQLLLDALDRLDQIDRTDDA